MFRKRKLKISKMLAAVIYIIENDTNINNENFDKLIGNLWDISCEIGGLSMMSDTMRCLEEIRKK